ncbi:PQQ-binding-like beta-propeller repeat protein [Alienimonas sp. DA493]|uniref:outer membrane protein assembly factor BamB family protein n=1 Tax=Alienimonas sp. DA493 TaxID=3373605 RepID=UPI0037542D72
MPPFVLLACALAAPDPVPAPAPTDWPAFLGPAGTGVSEETGLRPALPNAAAALQWTAEIGEGYSAPAVVTVRRGDDDGTPSVLTHRRVGRREVLVRRDLETGETLWESAAPTAFRDPYGYNGGPRASPLVVLNDGGDGGSVLTLGAAGRTACTDLVTGEERWSRDFHAELNIPRWFFGVGGSPVLYENPNGGALAIFAPGGQPNAGIVAVDPLTGETVWTAVGKDTWDGVPVPPEQGGEGPYEWTGEEQVVSYSTPLLATIHGEPHLLCLVRQGLVSLDPRTGEPRFAYWFRSPKYESVNAARPVVIGDRILLAATYRAGSVLLQVNAAGDGVTEAWRKPDLLDCHWSTPVVHDGLIYGFAGRHEREAELQCVDLETGELKWSANGRDAAGPLRFSREAGGYVDAAGERAPVPDFGRGSCLLAPRVGDGGTLYILGERGTLFCARPSADGYVERSRTEVPKIDYPAWPAPVLAHGRLLLADEESLTVLDLRMTNDE